ncbi:hypothetical protein E3P92_03691 [Wallemia ichthyophaga]|uniref:Uncharacterized protein n=1 Tax=Wallemia ichthyophaga TaxID=245174 RepID=A0A4T0IHV1_WALIC|nr:hypothetical protein E3P94_03707 [Wallemia ichthyophaga]TIB07956.1 hypothetical protein E3P93_03682 [Wallemia ichthyophaga]TIB08414.1 hypothetical protein E3P90_03697 [Wallemia ichthyophaga]TIB08697.1 hypothetical protein E3P92_03691 [Wallemia ichthyophaga]TIB19770.1 hypothetical protein E3P89_03656 [Wallemia ichthyophaga]
MQEYQDDVSVDEELRGSEFLIHKSIKLTSMENARKNGMMNVIFIFAFLPLLLLGNVLAHSELVVMHTEEANAASRPEIVVRPATPEWHIDF